LKFLQPGRDFLPRRHLAAYAAFMRRCSHASLGVTAYGDGKNRREGVIHRLFGDRPKSAPKADLQLAVPTVEL
jgi:hypothetical protein